MSLAISFSIVGCWVGQLANWSPCTKPTRIIGLYYTHYYTHYCMQNPKDCVILPLSLLLSSFSMVCRDWERTVIKIPRSPGSADMAGQAGLAVPRIGHFVRSNWSQVRSSGEGGRSQLCMASLAWAWFCYRNNVQIRERERENSFRTNKMTFDTWSLDFRFDSKVLCQQQWSLECIQLKLV